jgi:hypothetical protein
MESVGHDSRSSDRDSKQGLSEYKAGVQRQSALTSQAAKCKLSSSTDVPSIVNSSAFLNI